VVDKEKNKLNPAEELKLQFPNIAKDFPHIYIDYLETMLMVYFIGARKVAISNNEISDAVKEAIHQGETV
jgi:hypothetical protein